MEMSAYGAVKTVVRIMDRHQEAEHQVVHLQQYLGNALVVRTENINLGGK